MSALAEKSEGGATASMKNTGSDQTRRGLAGAIIGNAVENFDFSVYGYLATVLAVVFFDPENPTAALLATLATFASAFILRPVGGIIFGHFGDRLGRRGVLATTILLMSAATLAIGLLPSYAAVGITATVLLVLARAVQGLSAGGELAGAGAYLREIAPRGRVAFFVSFAQFGAFVGAIVASLTVLLLTTVLTPEQLQDWGWRIPFFLALPMGAVGLYIRSRLQDTEAITQVKESGEASRAPLIEVLTKHLRPLLQTFGISAMILSGFYVVYVYLAIYITTVLGESSELAFWSTTIVLVVSCACMPLFGMLADRVGFKAVIIGGGVAYLLLGYPLLSLMNLGGGWVLVGHIGLGLIQSALTAVGFGTFTSIFAARVRFTGVALGLNTASALVGGTAPLIAAWLVTATSNALAPIFFVMVCAIVGLIAAGTLDKRALARALDGDGVAGA